MTWRDKFFISTSLLERFPPIIPGYIHRIAEIRSVKIQCLKINISMRIQL